MARRARTFKSALIWCVPESPSGLAEEARKLLAWESIDEEDSGSLDDVQKRQLAENLKKALAGSQGIRLADL